jgi:hypothetical protein
MKRELWRQHISQKRFPAFPCPKCNEGTLDYKAEDLRVKEPRYSKSAHGHEAWDPEWIEERFSLMLECNLANCGEIVVMSGETMIDQVVNDDGNGWTYEQMLKPRTVFPYLNVIKLDEDVPKLVQEEIKASFLVFWSDLGASASRLRASVERVLDDFKIPATTASGGFLTLNDRIQQFKKIDPDHAETFDALRFVGNVGAHGDDLKREALLDAYEIYEDALEELFVKKKHKAKIDALKKRSSLQKGNTNSITARISNSIQNAAFSRC